MCDRSNNCREVLKEIRADKIYEGVNLTSHSIVVKAFYGKELSEVMPLDIAYLDTPAISNSDSFPLDLGGQTLALQAKFHI